ncbi:hypothetical protein OG943_17275 [Amycolatopsis sp. NBC_00345]|uniref:hypothetical protein n=1 Tax=Amycolatopsis sp. NBC_00345 TaxID=2975955 RepID=UPI002E256C48
MWIGASVIAAVVAAVGTGVANGGPAARAAAPGDAASDQPSALVEDYSYPGRDQILAEKHVKLLQGNGKIMLADCGGDLIEVHSRELGTICFRSTAPGGWLTVEIPKVYLGKAGSHAVGMRLTSNGKTEDHTLEPEGYAPFGEGADPQHAPTTLVEITTKS